MFAFMEIAFGLKYLTTKDVAAYNYASSFNDAQAPLGPARLTLSPVSAAELHAVAKTPPDPRDPTRSRLSAEALKRRQKAQLRLTIDRARVGGTQSRKGEDASYAAFKKGIGHGGQAIGAWVHQAQ